MSFFNSPNDSEARVRIKKSRMRARARSIANGTWRGPLAILGTSLLEAWSADRTELITLVAPNKVSSWKGYFFGYDMAQSTDASRPTYSATSMNGKPAITFDGTDDFLNLESMPFPTGAVNFEIWCVFTQDVVPSDATTRQLLSMGGTANGSRLALVRGNVAGTSRLRCDTGDGAAAQPTQDGATNCYWRHVVRAQFTPTTTTITIDNGTPVSAAVVPAIGSTRVRFGSNTANSPSAFWGGKIREVMVTGPVSTAQATAMWNYYLPKRSMDLVPPADFEAILTLRDADTHTNTGTAISAPPTYAYTLADQPNWDSRANTLSPYADSYIKQGRSNTVNAQSVRNWLVDFARQRAMRLSAGQVFPAGMDEGDFVTKRNWGCAMFAWCYLKTRNHWVYSYADKVSVEDWFSGMADDIMRYYQYTTDTLGSKQNNHLGWATHAAMLAAIITNRRDVFDWCVNEQKHILNDSMADTFVKEDSVVRPICGYNPDAGHLMPNRAMLMLDLDRYQAGEIHDGVYYNWYHQSNMMMTAINARKNGVNMFTYAGTNADLTSISAAYKAICDDAGAAVWAFIFANDVDNGATTSAALRVATHKVDADMSGFRLASIIPEISVLASAATIDANLTGKTQNILGGDIDYLRPFLA